MSRMISRKLHYVKVVLRRMLKQTNDKRLAIRVRIVLMSFGFAKVPHVVAVVGCSESTVRRTLAKFHKYSIAGLMDRREDNGEEKLCEEYLGALKELVEGTPLDYGYRRPTWTRELLAKEMHKRTGVRIHVATMSRALKLIGARRGRPRPTVKCPWSKWAKTRRMNAIKQVIAGCKHNEIVVYEDEVDIHLNPKIGLDWMNRGRQKEVLTPGQNEKRYLAGALNAFTGELTTVEGDKKTSVLFLHLLEKLVAANPRAKTIHVVLDNFRIHSSKIVQAALRDTLRKIQLHFLPPYCPNENKIERVWKDLHDEVTRNHQHAKMTSLMQAVRHYVRYRNHHKTMIAHHGQAA